MTTTKTRRRRMAAPMTLGMLGGLAFLIATQGVAAQEDANTDKPPAKERQPQPAKAASITSQSEGVMGPVQPPRRAQASISAGKPSPARRITPRKPAGIPEPTVVLKPGEVPAIKFDTPTYDFGRVRAGLDIVHDFWFTNTGTGPLEILKVRPG